MLLPSLSIIFLGVVFAAVLMAINRYVWGRAWAGDIRQPGQVTPFAGKALIEQALARLIATNQAVLPQITLTRPPQRARREFV
jgi:hypothetical protein